MGLISRVSSRTYRGIYTQRTWRYEAISKNTQSSGENCHPPWSQTPSCSDNRSSLQTPLPPSPGSGNSCLTTRRSTRRSERLSSAAKSTRNTQDALRTTVFGSGTTPGVPVRTCTESTETSRSTRLHPGPPNQTGKIQRVPTTTKQSHARPKHQIPTPATSLVQESPARATILRQTTQHRLLNAGFWFLVQNVKKLKKLFAYLTSLCDNLFFVE